MVGNDAINWTDFLGLVGPASAPGGVNPWNKNTWDKIGTKPEGPKGLAAKIFKKYQERFFGIGDDANAVISFVDEQEEILSDEETKRGLKTVYQNYLKSLRDGGQLSTEWKELTVPENTSAHTYVGYLALVNDKKIAPLHLPFWLGTAGDNEMGGKFEARCEGGKNFIRKKRLDFVWVDRIDSRPGVEPGLFGWVEDANSKVEAVIEHDFDVRISWKDHRPGEEAFPNVNAPLRGNLPPAQGAGRN